MKYRSLTGYKYQLAEDVSVAVPLFADVTVISKWFTLKRGVLTVTAGYCWDGPSGPTYDSENSMLPSLVHDALYQMIRAGLIAEDRAGDADYELDRLSRDRGMSAFRRLIWFNGLSLFGFNAAKLRKVEPQDVILTAP